MSRRRPPRFMLAALVLLAAATSASSIQAQPRDVSARLCFLTFDPENSRSTRYAGFFARLGDLGYIDGQNLRINYMSADGRNDRYPALVDECLKQRPDVIVASTTPAAQAAKRATATIPIVMLALGDPVGTGLVSSLARPGANVTGLSFMAPGVGIKRLELLKEMLPTTARVLVLTHRADPISAGQIAELEAAARSLSLALAIHDVNTIDDLAKGFEAGVRAKADAFVTTTEAIFAINRDQLVAEARRHALPGVLGHQVIVEAGALMSFSAVFPALYARAAAYVDKILKGARPSDLPIEQPTEFALTVNLKAARELGIVLPHSILLRADNVIE